MSKALDHLAAAAERFRTEENLWRATRDAEILAARQEGATWEAIADAADMSRAGVINAGRVAAARRER